MGGQIIDATLIAAPRQKLTVEEKAIIRDGGTPEGWSRAKRAQKDPGCPLDAQARAYYEAVPICWTIWRLG
jgi:hypothetical protein